MSIRILVADDHQIVREGFRSLLDKEPEMEVVGEASDGRTALQLVQECSPDVVLMDITMPDMNGIEATLQILSQYPGMKIVILSMHKEEEYLLKALHAGTKGYILKNCAFQELVSAIHTVYQGNVYLSPSITGIFVDNFLQTSTKEISPISMLSSREREILQLLAEGFSSKDIAAKLDLSVKTVDVHRQHVMDKLDIHNVVQLAKYAIREGLASLDA